MRAHVLLHLFAALIFCNTATVKADEQQSTVDMDIANLLSLEVTSVSKVAEPLSKAAAAIHVITAKELSERGVTSIPEALKFVPGLHVAQLDSHKWAISSRGFNGRYNNKMLVLVDGRVQYSPDYSGVYWETTDTLIKDIDRIEVIRGPAAALWGLNAVNGVINITTKHTMKTLGGYAEVGLGSKQDFAGFRYGGLINDKTAIRGYAKAQRKQGLDMDLGALAPALQNQALQQGTDNDYLTQQIGARLDSSLSPASDFRLSFDAYQTRGEDAVITPSGQYIADTMHSHGWNILSSYSLAMTAHSEIELSGYFEHTTRAEEFIGFSRDNAEVEFKHHFSTARHSLLTGAALRYVSTNFNLSDQFLSTTLPNDNENTQLYSFFISDQWTLVSDKLWLTMAGRVDKHNYAETQLQPSIRLSWQPTAHQTLWTAWSKAVRLPSQLELEAGALIGVLPANAGNNPLPFPASVTLLASPDYDVEEVRSIELGYRFDLHDGFSIDSTAFYNEFDQLRSFRFNSIDLAMPPALSNINLNLSNDSAGHNSGFETALNWQATPTLLMELNYSYINGKFSANSSQITTAPENIVSVISTWTPSNTLSVNLAIRYVDKLAITSATSLSDRSTRHYTTADINLNWSITDRLTLSAHGRNLLQSKHVEFKPELFYSTYKVEPSFFTKLSYAF